MSFFAVTARGWWIHQTYDLPSTEELQLAKLQCAKIRPNQGWWYLPECRNVLPINFVSLRHSRNTLTVAFVPRRNSLKTSRKWSSASEFRRFTAFTRQSRYLWINLSRSMLRLYFGSCFCSRPSRPTKSRLLRKDIHKNKDKQTSHSTLLSYSIIFTWLNSSAARGCTSKPLIFDK